MKVSSPPLIQNQQVKLGIGYSQSKCNHRKSGESAETFMRDRISPAMGKKGGF